MCAVCVLNWKMILQSGEGGVIKWSFTCWILESERAVATVWWNIQPVSPCKLYHCSSGLGGYDNISSDTQVRLCTSAIRKEGNRQRWREKQSAPNIQCLLWKIKHVLFASNEDWSSKSIIPSIYLCMLSLLLTTLWKDPVQWEVGDELEE